MTAVELEFHLAVRSEVEIDAAAAVIWSYLERPREWKPSIVSLQRIDGHPGREGEVLKVGQRPSEATVHVIMRTVRLEPDTWRVQTLVTEDGRATDGFVLYSLYPAGAATRLVCEVVARCAVRADSIGSLTMEEFARTVNAATREKLDADHRVLKALIERPR